MVNFDIGRQHFFVGLNPFFDLGIVTQPYQVDEEAVTKAVEAGGEKVSDYFSFSKSDLYRPHMAAGIGLKVGMNENFVLSCDWAMPVNSSYYLHQDNGNLANFYVKMGYLF